ncbi:hypothetical protein QN374_15230, partial [Herbaspirillum sp. RTI4]|nr:hypothetical protein [Herbaspirillum sp. RTI4]
ITAIYADPAPENQYKLISILHKKILSAAVLISDETEYLRPALIQAAEKNSLSLILENISGRNNINYALNNIKYIPFLLAIPDENIYSPESIKNILITTYRHNQPMIGYSSALVKAGALASIHSDISEIITQMDEQLTEYDKTGKWPAPQFPKYFHVVVNEDVARSFNITIENDVRKFSYPPPSDES